MTEFQSLIFYIVSFALSAIFIHLGNRPNSKKITFQLFRRKISINPFVILGLTIPTLIGGLRYVTGVDYWSYHSKIMLTDQYDPVSFSQAYGNVEPSLWYIGRLSLWLTGGPVLWFTLTSFITILFFYLGAKRFGVKNIALFMLLILFVIFPQALAGVRQGVAMALCLYAFSFIKDRRLLVYLVIIGLTGFFFHTSAFAMLLIYPLYHFVTRNTGIGKNDNGKMLRRILLVIMLLPLLFFITVAITQWLPFPVKYSIYFSEAFSERYGGLNQNILPEIFAMLLMTLVLLRNRTKKYAPSVIMATMLTPIMFGIVSVLGQIIPLAGRLGDYFMPVFFLIFADIHSHLRIQKRSLSMIVIMYALLFFIWACYFRGSGTIFPYNSILWGLP